MPECYVNFVTALGHMHSCFRGDGEDVLLRILKTSTEMLQDRGMTEVVRASNVCHAIESMDTPVVRGSDAEELRVITLFIHPEERVGVKHVRTILEKYPSHLNIIVSLEGPTPFTRKECERKSIQFFFARDLCVNKTKHCLVPRHEVVDEKDLPSGVTLTSLPRIPDSDPIVQYYNFHPGTVVKVQRVFGGHEPIPYYRLVQATT